ncbi:hypothetical protein B0T12DRAFT_418165 [Alternaria alternata]|nr:hypothetical protein B0T12DRAFT_418165 [Alternaria alternata]
MLGDFCDGLLITFNSPPPHIQPACLQHHQPPPIWAQTSRTPLRRRKSSHAVSDAPI